MNLARIHRWWHTLTGMFKGHQGMDYFDDRGRTIAVCCTCGKVFWAK